MFFGVFTKFVNAFAKKYTPQLFLLVISSTIAASFEFLGLSIIYTFTLILSKNTIYIPFLSDLDFFQTQTNMAFGLGLIIAIIYILKDIYMIAHVHFQNSLLTNISNDVFRKNYTNFISQNYFSTRKLDTSDKFKILDSSINTVVNVFCGSVLSLFANLIVTTAILLYLLLKFQINAVFISLLVFLIWQIENKYFKNKAKKHGEQLHYAEREKYNFVLSTINAQKDIIIYNKENSFEKIACNAQKKYAEQKKIITTNTQLPSYITEISVMIAFISFILLLLAKNYSIANLSASLATIAAVVIRLAPTINKTQYCLQGINAGKFEAQWFCTTVLELYGTNKKHKTTNKKMPFENTIKFKNVNFYYETNAPTLKNINLEIKKGEFIGITGPSGSGKTTLFNLICALYEPNSGKIFIDDTDLNTSNKKLWQNNINILSQEFSIPFKTVWQNVLLEPDINAKKDTAAINNALKMANIFDEINGDINKNTDELSSGQKHRIALARAFYYNRDIIMLDEATAALDSETENEINKSIENLRRQKTIIAIAHRIKTLKNCDKIIYINNGEIIDIGTLNELKNKHGSFKHLIELSQF